MLETRRRRKSKKEGWSADTEFYTISLGRKTVKDNGHVSAVQTQFISLVQRVSFIHLQHEIIDFLTIHLCRKTPPPNPSNPKRTFRKGSQWRDTPGWDQESSSYSRINYQIKSLYEVNNREINRKPKRNALRIHKI